MSSTSSQALADSVSGSSEPECAPSHSAKSNRSAEPCSLNDGQACPVIQMSASCRQIDWVETESRRTSSVEASPARTSVTPLAPRQRGSQASDPGCGSRCGDSCASSDPLGCSLRMFLASELSELTQSSLTWRKQATPQGHSWWVLSMPERTTSGDESGFLPTPTACQYGTNQGGAAGRVGKVRPSLRSLVLTPTAKANLTCPSMQKWKGARAFTDLLPTPAARNWRSGKASEGTLQRNSRPLNEVLQACGHGKQDLLTVTRWLMGYPKTWTLLSKPMGIPSSRRSRNSSGGQS